MTIETFYGMQRMPFTTEDATAPRFHTPTWDEVLSRLQYAVDHAGWALVTGECGVGKSTVIRALCQRLDPATSGIGYLADSKLTPWTLYPALLATWGGGAPVLRPGCQTGGASRTGPNAAPGPDAARGRD